MTQKIDNKDLDVIVIGASPAGGSCARELLKLGRKTFYFRVLLKYPQSLTLWAHRNFFGELTRLWHSSI